MRTSSLTLLGSSDIGRGSRRHEEPIELGGILAGAAFSIMLWAAIIAGVALLLG